MGQNEKRVEVGEQFICHYSAIKSYVIVCDGEDEWGNPTFQPLMPPVTHEEAEKAMIRWRSGEVVTARKG